MEHRVDPILESATDAGLSLDRAWQVQAANTAAFHLFERLFRTHPLTQATGGLWEILPASLGAVIRAECEQAVRTPAHREFETPVSDGKHWLHVEIFPRAHDTLLFFRDITAFQQLRHPPPGQIESGPQPAPNAAKPLEECVRLERALQAGETCAWEWNLGTGELLASLPTQHLMGIRNGQVDDFIRLLHPEDRSRFLHARDEALTYRKPYKIEVRLIRPDGEIRWLQCRAAAEFSAAGEPLRLLGLTADITEQKLADEQFHWEHEFRKAIEQSVQAGLATADLEGRQTYVNPEFCRMVGWNAEELIGHQPPYPYWPPEDREHIQTLFNETLRGENPPEGYEIRLLRSDGTRIDTLVKPAPLRDTDGNLWGWLVAVLDISEIRKAQRALEDSEARFRAVIDNSPTAIYIKDLEGRYTLVNRTHERSTQIEPQQALGHHDSELYPPEVARQLRENDQVVLRSGHPLEFEEHLPTPSGEPRVYLSVKFPLRDAAGTLYGVGGVSVDITGRKRTEDALRASEALLHAVIDNVEAFVYVKDREGRLLLINRYYENTLGVPRSQVLGRTDYDIFPKDLADVFRASDLKVLETGEPMRIEEILPHPDGRLHTCLTLKFPLRDPDGHVYAAVGVSTDITERKTIEEALRRQAEALQDADRRKNEFLAMLAHELRNPLAAISNASLVLAHIPPPNEHERILRERISRHTTHLARLVDDLLDVSRITQSRIELRREPVNLQTIVERAVEMSETLIKSRGHQLTVSLPAKPVWIEGDPARLEQVLENLLSNAAKYTEPGGQIHVSAERSGNDAVLRVRDNGVGIAPELQPYIFDLFVQGDRSSARSQGGLGIGLTLVRNLVQMHGGSIFAYSEGIGRGSEFIVRLPALPEHWHAANLEPSPRAEVDREPNQPRRILVVEDNLDAAETLQELLELWGHEVRIAGTGEEALSAAHRFHPEFVLLDIGLPGIDGYEVARRFRADPEFKTVRLIALTGYGQIEDQRQALEAGFDRHLVKPLDPAILQLILSEGVPHSAPTL